MNCIICDRKICGFWIYGKIHVCSKKCLREGIQTLVIERLDSRREYKELGILPPKKVIIEK